MSTSGVMVIKIPSNVTTLPAAAPRIFRNVSLCIMDFTIITSPIHIKHVPTMIESTENMKYS